MLEAFQIFLNGTNAQKETNKSHLVCLNKDVISLIWKAYAKEFSNMELVGNMALDILRMKNVSSLDMRLRFPLILKAISMGHTDMIEYLMGGDRQNCVEYLCEARNLRTFRFLLEKYPGNFVTKSGEFDNLNEMTYVVNSVFRNGYLDIAQFLVDKFQAHHPDYVFFEATAQAVLSGNVDVVAFAHSLSRNMFPYVGNIFSYAVGSGNLNVAVQAMNLLPEENIDFNCVIDDAKKVEIAKWLIEETCATFSEYGILEDITFDRFEKIQLCLSNLTRTTCNLDFGYLSHFVLGTRHVNIAMYDYFMALHKKKSVLPVDEFRHVFLNDIDYNYELLANLIRTNKVDFIRRLFLNTCYDNYGVLKSTGLRYSARENNKEMFQFFYENVPKNTLSHLQYHLIETSLYGQNIEFVSWIYNLLTPQPLDHPERGKNLIFHTRTWSPDAISLIFLKSLENLMPLLRFDYNILSLACRLGNLEVVEWLHFSRPEFKSYVSNENTRCHAIKGAACHGHLEIVKFLCKHRPRDCFTGKAIVLAASNEHFEVVKYLHEEFPRCRNIHAISYLSQYYDVSPSLDIIKYFYHNLPRNNPETPFAIRNTIRRADRLYHYHISEWVRQQAEIDFPSFFF